MNVQTRREMFDMLNAEGEGSSDNEYDKAMAASVVDVTSFFHQEKDKNAIWQQEAGASTAATTRGAETNRFGSTDAGDMPKYEIAKLTEDVMESAIDSKEWHQECRRVERQLQIIHNNVKRFGQPKVKQ